MAEGGRFRTTVIVAGAAIILLAAPLKPPAHADARPASPSVESRDTPGEALWVKRYNGPSSSEDAAVATVTSPDASTVFVTGWSVGSGGSYPHDYATAAYDTSSGAQKWTRRYDGP